MERVSGATAPVIDAHTHLFPPDVVRDRDAFLARDRWFGLLYANPKAACIAGEALLAAMDEAGVDGAVACGFPWADPGLCREHNEALHAAAAASGGRLAWLATVSPIAGAEAASEAERCFAFGAAGIGELNADAQGFDLRSPRALAAIAEVCLAHDRPVMLHASEPVGHDYPGKGAATPDALVAFLAAQPALSVVLAHWGGGLPFYELMPEVAAVTARVVYDTAASTYLYRFGVFRAALDLVGRKRVLWASDHPVLGVGRFLRRTREQGALRPEEIEPVFGGNAARVYKFVPPSPAAPTHDTSVAARKERA